MKVPLKIPLLSFDDLEDNSDDVMLSSKLVLEP